MGVGLIGGSIGLALRARRLAECVIGAGSRPATLDAALELGAITEIAADVRAAAARAELIVVCAPVGHIVEQVRAMAPHCRAGTLITDAGSTKAQIVHELSDAAAADSAWPGEVVFIGSHPLAGTEKKGPRHATAELFANRTVVITPTPAAEESACVRLTEFWSSLGAGVVRMSADEHDRALALTSHLPHLVAAAVAGGTPAEFVPLTAGGWRDLTRIAAGDPALWRQILLANRANLQSAVDDLIGRLAEWRGALETADAEKLETLLSEAKRIRDSAP